MAVSKFDMRFLALPIILLIAFGIFYFAVALFAQSFLNSNSAPIGPGYRLAQIGSSVFRLEISQTIRELEQGLSGRDSMPENEGMLFLFNKPSRYGFWMKGMKFPLDIIWLKNGQIVYLAENAPPMDDSEPVVYYPKSEADTVIELNAGEAKKLGLRIGNPLSL